MTDLREDDRVLTAGGVAPDADKAANAVAPETLRRKAEMGESREDALLDEGLEETFPASDPVAAKHIT